MVELPLSLCVITLNEEKNIRRCLSSVPFASEIIVLDSGSTDTTRTLAQDLGAKVFNEAWRGFGPQKQRAIDLASNDWVLCLDADEQLTPELQNEIMSLFSDPEKMANGYRLPRRSFHLGRWLYHGGWYPDYQARLFSRSKLSWSTDALHESVKGDNILTLNSDLNHFPFQSLADQVHTNNQYSTLGVTALQKKNKRTGFWHLLIKPSIKFIELYFVKQGFRDGMPGFIIAVGGAYSYFLKFAKLWEQQKVANGSSPIQSLESTAQSK